MGFNLEEDNPIPTAKESEDRIEQDAPLALAYLRRRGELDVVGALGLTAYV